MAGARTPEAMTPREIERLIRAAGREPVERDTLYNVVARADGRVDARPAPVAPVASLDAEARMPRLRCYTVSLAFSSPGLRKVSQELAKR